MKKIWMVSLALFVISVGSQSDAQGVYNMADYWNYQTPGYRILFKDLKDVQGQEGYTSLTEIENLGEVSQAIFEQKWNFRIVNADRIEDTPYRIGFGQECTIPDRHPPFGPTLCRYPSVIIETYQINTVDSTEESDFNIFLRQLFDDKTAGIWQPKGKVISELSVAKLMFYKNRTEQQLNRFINNQLNNPFDSPITVKTGILKNLSIVRNIFLDGKVKNWLGLGSILLFERLEFNDRISEDKGYTQILYWLKKGTGIVRMEIWDHFYDSDKPQLQMAVGAYDVEN